MKIALVHDRIFPGGALQVFEDMIQEEKAAFPDAHFVIFTMLAEASFRQVQGIEVREALPPLIAKLFTSCSGRNIPLLSALFDYRNLFVFYPQIMWLLSRKLRRRKPERVLISSYAIAKNLSLPCKKKPFTKLYLHSPMQYIWSHQQEYLGKFQGRKRKLFEWMVPRLQQRDLRYQEFDEVLFNSQYTKTLAQELYGMQGNVRYPQIRKAFLEAKVVQVPQSYFVCVGRLVRLVRECDLIIKAFTELKLPLLMIGDGPDAAYLKSLAGDNIIFLGHLDTPELIKVMQSARGLINLTKESFGIGTAEALCLGLPVLAFGE